MSAKKLIQFEANLPGLGTDQVRIIRLHRGMSVIEKRDGSDWLGVERWHCLSRMAPRLFRNISLDGETHAWIRDDLVRDLLSALGDAMMREKKKGRPKTRRAGKRGGGRG